MDNCKFQVGQTYKTRDGRAAKVVAILPEDAEYQGLVVLIGDSACLYFGNGRLLAETEHGLDLLPNKRTVWVNFYEESEAVYYSNEAAAERVAASTSAPRIGNRAYPVEIDD